MRSHENPTPDPHPGGRRPVPHPDALVRCSTGFLCSGGFQCEREQSFIPQADPRRGQVHHRRVVRRHQARVRRGAGHCRHDRPDGPPGLRDGQVIRRHDDHSLERCQPSGRRIRRRDPSRRGRPEGEDPPRVPDREGRQGPGHPREHHPLGHGLEHGEPHAARAAGRGLRTRRQAHLQTQGAEPCRCGGCSPGDARGPSGRDVTQPDAPAGREHELYQQRRQSNRHLAAQQPDEAPRSRMARQSLSRSRTTSPGFRSFSPGTPPGPSSSMH